MSVDIHALSGAYAVDAVDEFERAQFERHLADCASCRAEVESLREAGSLLSETSARPAPDSLRASVLAGIQNVRPLPPVVVAAAERGRSTRRRFPALVAAAAALIAVGGLGATVWHPWSSETPAAYEQVADAPDATTYTGQLDNGGTIEVVRSKSRNSAVISTDGLESLPDFQTYQLWLIHDGHFDPAGLMDADAANVLLKGDASTATQVGITVEPAGGSEVPNLDSAVTVDLA